MHKIFDALKKYKWWFLAVLLSTLPILIGGLLAYNRIDLKADNGGIILALFSGYTGALVGAVALILVTRIDREKAFENDAKSRDEASDMSKKSALIAVKPYTTILSSLVKLEDVINICGDGIYKVFSLPGNEGDLLKKLYINGVKEVLVIQLKNLTSLAVIDASEVSATITYYGKKIATSSETDNYENATTISDSKEIKIADKFHEIPLSKNGELNIVVVDLDVYKYTTKPGIRESKFTYKDVHGNKYCKQTTADKNGKTEIKDELINYNDIFKLYNKI